MSLDKGRLALDNDINVHAFKWMCLFRKCLWLWCIVVFDKFVCIFCDL